MAASEQDLFNCFVELGIDVTTTRHRAVHTVDESRDLRGKIPGCHCKSLFLKDKKGRYLLVILKEDRSLDMKGLFKSGRLPIARLSFARTEAMVELLGVTPGSVTPFSLINVDRSLLTTENFFVILDQEMMGYDLLNYHPLHNEATTTIAQSDLVKFIAHFGFNPLVIDFDNL